MTASKAAVIAIRSYLPETKLTNEQLARDFPEWDVDKLYAMTGVSVRSISGPDECASDLAVAAAERLFAEGECCPEDIDFIVLCTQSPDYIMPATACIVQDRLGIPRTAGAFDLNLGCSAFAYALAVVKGLIETGSARCVLLLTGDTSTKRVHPQDRTMRPLFGDGGTATLVAATDCEQDQIGPFVFGTDGRGAGNLIVPGSGTRRASEEQLAAMGEIAPGVPHPPGAAYMNGPEIFSFSQIAAPAAVKALLAKAGLDKLDVDHYVFHQANAFMLAHLRKLIKIPEDRFCVNLESYGNTAASTIPMALEIARDSGQIRDGQRVMLVGFGIGYSWCATFITFGQRRS